MRKLLLFLFLLTVPAYPQNASQPTAASPSTRVLTLQRQVQALVTAHRSHLRAGVCILHLPSGDRVELDANTPYPLASVFKLPIMIELARQMQAGTSGVALSKHLVLREQDKCIGSGVLRTHRAGSQIRVDQAVELMETISDNTATDLIFNLIGVDSVNRLMQSLGLQHSNIYITNRPAYLISLGLGSGFKTLTARQIANKWQNMSAEERRTAAQRVLQENRSLPLATFQHVEDASAARQTGTAYRDDCLLAAALDNLSSPADVADLLRLLDQGKLLNGQWTRYCLGVLGRQKFNSRIPRDLPPGTRTYHKTGTIAGIVNDAGIIELGPHNHLVVVVLTRDVAEGRGETASALIGKIARAAYDAYR